MKQLPKISIVIPVYNVEEYVAECIQSVMRQTYKGKIECILVDGGGTDSSMTIVRELIAKYKGNIDFRIVRDDYNRGLSGSRNNGTENATGDYVYYLDSDDYIADDCIETLASPLQSRNYDMVVGDFKEFGGSRVTFYNREEREITGRENIIAEICEQTLYVMAWNKLISMNIIRRNNVRFIEQILHEDVPWSFEIGSVLKCIYVVNHVTYLYRIRPKSLADVDKKVKSDREYKSYVSGLNRILECAKERGVYGEEYDVFLNSLVCRAIFIGLENDVDISKDYKRFRDGYKRPCGLNVLLHDPKAFKRRLHWYLPFGIADRFLKWKFNRSKNK